MLSRISKMSVLGIVALMLVLGLTADEAFAQVSKIVEYEAAGTLRAAGQAQSITFTLKVSGQIDAGANNNPPETPASTVTINIPNQWVIQPIEAVGTADAEGEVTFDFDKGTQTGRDVGKVVGRNLVIDVDKAAAGNGTYTIVYAEATPPNRKGTYRFGVSGAQYGDADVDGTVEDTLEVDWAESASGTIALTSHTPSSAKIGNANHPWFGNYLFTSDQDLGNVTFVYTAVGSMPKETQIRITLAGKDFTIPTDKLRRDVLTVSGAGNPEPSIDPGGTWVEATVKADGGIGPGSQITITIKQLKAATVGADGKVVSTDRTFTPSSSLSTVETGDAAIETAILRKDNANVVFTFYTSAKPGTAELGIMSADGDAPATFAQNTAVQAGTNLGALTLGITNTDATGPDSKFQIKVPDAFPAPIEAPFLVGGGRKTDEAGHTVGGTPNSGNRTISGNLKDPNDSTTVNIALAGGITYRVGKIETQGRHEFVLRTSSGPHTTLTDRTGDNYHRYIDVTAKHDAGSLTVYKADSTEFTESAPEQVHDLTLVYRAGGYMPSGSVTFWRPIPTASITDASTAANGTGPEFRNDNADSVDQPGEVTANVPITVAADGSTVTATGNWNAGTEIRVEYKDYKVPGAAADAPVEYTFRAKVRSFGTDIDNVNEDYKVGAGRTADGSGSIVISPDSANSNTATDLTVTFTAAGAMEDGSQVKLILPPAPWPRLSVTGTSIEVIGGASESDDNSITATTINDLAANGTIVFKINGVTTPAVGGPYEFTAESKAIPGGQLRPLSNGTAITINQVTAGTVALSTTSAEPGAFIDDLMITFTAGAQMASGSKVTVQIPAAFTSVRPDNNDGIDDAGEVLLAGSADLGVSGGGTTPWVLTATTNAVINAGGTLVITYKDVTAPAAEDVYTFMTEASVVASQGLLPVAVQPTFTVRKAVTAIAMVSDPDPATVFIGDSITLTVSLWAGTEAGNALGNQVVMLSDGDAGGTFMPASITIADNAHEGSATYTSSTAGPVTLTATLGDLDPVSVEATIKSKIRDLMVNGMTEGIVVAGGQSITVSAIGQAGTGTVTIKDADGNKVGLTRALDPVGEVDPDGDQQFERAVMLPESTVDGEYTVNIMINDQPGSISITVLNDQAPPMLSNASVLSNTDPIANGSVLTLSVDVVAASESNPIDTVMADLSELDSEQTDMVPMTKQAGTDSTYIAIHTISMDNTHADGAKTVTFSAQAMIGDASTATAMVNLENDPSTLDSVNVPDDTFRPGDMVTITATGTAGQSVKFTVTSPDGTAMPSGQAMTEEPADSGMYMGTFAVVADVHTEGMYDVTVTMNDNPAKSISKADSLDIGPAGYMFTLSIPAGTHAIHIPLAVNMINGKEGTIKTVGDVYDALGDAVNFIISFSGGVPVSYLGDESAGSMADAAIGGDTGLIAVMKSAATLELVGDALGTGGTSMISIGVGNNLVGVPLDPAVDMMISDALVPGVEAIAVSNAAGDGFHTITAAGDMGDGPVMGGVGYIVVASAAGSIPIVGSAWENDGAMMAAPAVAFSGSQTPVLHVSGGLLDEFDMMSRIPELRVTVKNLSTGASLDTVLGTELSETAYSGTFVEFSRHAAKAGDVLEITAHSPSPYVGVRPVPQIVVSAEEVLTSRISLPDLELYEIPSETELLANYPNPFNPETWIPYRLAKAAKVSLEIYDTNGSLVRSIDVGFKPAAVYESRASAIYWDGRNNYGERVASGTYFYHLTAGEDYASTRRMVILK